MTDKSTDTLEQIADIIADDIVDNFANDKGAPSDECLAEILAIAIKSPEAAEYWLNTVIEMADSLPYRGGTYHYPVMIDKEDLISGINKIKEAQSE